jgi:hypothetical protein
MKILQEKISEVISQNIRDLNSVFVFPTDVVKNSWIDWTIKNPQESGVRAFNLEQFAAWDVFKSTSLKSVRENSECIPSVVRKIFAEKIIAENNEKNFFKKIISSDEKFKDNAFGFSAWIAKILPSLKSWNDRYEKFYSAKKNSPDEEDHDYRELFLRYTEFLEQNDFYEPSFLDADFKETGKKIFIFFPETLEDFSDFEETLSNSPDIFLVKISDEQKKLSRPCTIFENAREEIRFLALRLRQLHLNGTDLRRVAVSVPDLQKIRQYVERELSLYAVPFVVRAGIPYTKNCGGGIFLKIKNCIAENFSYDSVRQLLLDGYIPWKNFSLNEKLVREGKERRCICSYEEKNSLRDIWLSSLKNESDEKKFYMNLKSAVKKFGEAKSFAEVKIAWDRFKNFFMDEKKFSDINEKSRYEMTDKILGRIVTELNELVSMEKKYAQKIGYRLKSYFDFFVDEISGGIYKPDEKKYGVNIFPYRLSSCGDFDFQFVIDASQNGISVPFKKLNFVKDVDKREKFGLDENDASVAFISLYDAPQRPEKKCVYFSCAQENFSGSAIMHTSFFAEKISAEEKNSLEKFDFVSAEKKSFMTGDSSDREISALQKKAFANWKSANRSDENFSPRISERFRKKILSFSTQENSDRKIRISQSSLNSFFDCPRKFVFSRILKLQDETLEVDLMQSYEIGTLIHKIIELVFCEEKKIGGRVIPVLAEKENEIKKMVEEKFDEAKFKTSFSCSRLALDVIESQKKIVCRNVFDFLQEFCRADQEGSGKNGFGNFLIESVEEPLQKENSGGEFLFVGKIDCVLSEKRDGEKIIVDYKTGRLPTAAENILCGDPEKIGDFQISTYVKILEGENQKVNAAVFCGVKKIGKKFEKNWVIDETHSTRSNAIPREKFDVTLAELESCGKKFYEKICACDFSVTDFWSDKKFGVNVFEKCASCNFNSVCRTSFNIGKKELEQK